MRLHLNNKEHLQKISEKYNIDYNHMSKIAVGKKKKSS
jgi:hypothetical protein